MSAKIGAGVHVLRSSSATSPFGITRARFSARPPPVMCANVRTSASAIRARRFCAICAAMASAKPRGGVTSVMRFSSLVCGTRSFASAISRRL